MSLSRLFSVGMRVLNPLLLPPLDRSMSSYMNRKASFLMILFPLAVRPGSPCSSFMRSS